MCGETSAGRYFWWQSISEALCGIFVRTAAQLAISRGVGDLTSDSFRGKAIDGPPV